MPHSGIAGVYDFTWGSIDESVGRQFDDATGGGFADEFGAFVDPTRRASEQTEQDVGTYAEFTLAGLAPAAAIGGAATNQDSLDPFGQADELLGRQFDRERGGGAADEAIRISEDVWNDATPNVPFNAGQGLAGIAAALVLLAVVYIFGTLFEVTV